MTTEEIRKKFLQFFVSKDHKEIMAAPLVLENDPTTLFTSAGMQPLVPYLLGQPHPLGPRLVNSQPCFRTEDIEEVGDGRHTTYFEMLGNWSLGDYFKKEQLAWMWKFYSQVVALPKEKLYVTVFVGDKNVPKDEDSYEVWRNLGIKDDHIFWYGVEKNWWSRSGAPDAMKSGDIGGPDSEIFFDFGLEHDPKFGKECHPNCPCGRFLEIGNSVFIEYRKNDNGELEELAQKNVDFGGGLERIAAASNNNPDIFKTDALNKFVQIIEQETETSYGKLADKDRSIRIVADHLRASVQLIKAGVRPSNKLHGYVLRRLLRRSIFHLHRLGRDSLSETFLNNLSDNDQNFVNVLSDEAKKFSQALDRGLHILYNTIKRKDAIDGKLVFDLYQSHGFPQELTLEILAQEGIVFSQEERKKFEDEFQKHKDLSRNWRGRMV